MVQGLVKKTNATKAKQRENKKANQPKKGARVIAPKKASLIKQKQLQKKLTANINRNIEVQMATRASAVGKLTIMRSLVEKEKNKTTKK